MRESKPFKGGGLPDATVPEIDGSADQVARWASGLAAINNYMRSLSVQSETGMWLHLTDCRKELAL